MICIHLIGLPGTGKSTFAKHRFPDMECLSTDNYIEAHKGSRTYNEAFNDLIGPATRAMQEKAQILAEQQELVVWDQTNLRAKKRKKIFETFPGYEHYAVVFSRPKNWEQILASRPGKTIDKKVLNWMINSYEEPQENEGYTKIYRV